MTHPADTKKPRQSHLRWVELGVCKVFPAAQGEFRPAHRDYIAANFDLEAVGFPAVSFRDGTYWIIDGQHRVAAALKFGFGLTDKLQMEVYEGLTPAGEAELFIERNTVKAKSAWDRFKVSVTAGREEECHIDRLVRAQGLMVAGHRSSTTIASIGALREIYRLAGPSEFSRTLRVIRDAFGAAGFDADVIRGVGRFLHRYGLAVDEAMLVKRMAAVAGGLNGLRQSAQKLRLQMGYTFPECIASEVTKAYNRVSGGKKLPPWFKA
ncbi:MAG: hypothetical protein IT301_06255 [Dehalococcoidia bacterium]|nr:hypothetical protein [Dehalococcoidia bacterium]